MMIDGQGLMVAMDVVGKQLAQAVNENAQLREQLQALAGHNTDAG
ncbi:hypothetical protein [Microbacterium foliorum]|nr:hypothetical protein [Microbacterium foliorum]